MVPRYVLQLLFNENQKIVRKKQQPLNL